MIVSDHASAGKYSLLEFTVDDAVDGAVMKEACRHARNTSVGATLNATKRPRPARGRAGTRSADAGPGAALLMMRLRSVSLYGKSSSSFDNRPTWDNWSNKGK
ncbi:hypothetical protein ABT247_29000 [Kitasatospora sp. NPDC001539]|uniref:hypothetical protein n=1 Tax=Kitasatospora sp. NPDC001539 TaxID=3154384 RepID=UPI00331D417C